mmetsp:Transcript_51234/g.123687  ORF Transcript_51234/g.123687 Transcript_51234/m.123687 type:complete len:663 (-) Transcript_51234:159-2147(-)
MSSNTAPTEKNTTTMETNVAYYDHHQQQQQQQQQAEYLYKTLARQLEYYFCTKNLLRDTYVQTLRSLNDGCVPVSILVGFGKAGTITAALTATLKTMKELSSSPNQTEKKNSKDAEAENKTAAATASVSSPCDDADVVVDIDSEDLTSIAMQIVHTVATKYSVLLDMFKIDNETGKKASAGDNQQQRQRPWRWAVGTVSGHPIPMQKIESYVPPLAPADTTAQSSVSAAGYVPAALVAPTQPPTLDNAAAGGMSSTTTTASTFHHQIANTIILRDVPTIDSNESTIRNLFANLRQKGGVDDDASSSPAIVEAHLDVHDCWFVTFETTSRDVMADIMLKLRRKKYPSSGIQVQARIKSIATPSPNTYRPVQRPKSLTTNNGTGKCNKSSRKRSSNNRSRSRGNKDQHQQRQAAPSTSTSNGVNNDDNSPSQVAGPTVNKKGTKHRSGSESSKNNKPGTNSPTTDATVHTGSQQPPTLGEHDFPTLPLPIPASTKTVIRVERSLTLGKNEDDDLLICNGDGELDEDDSDVQSNGKVRCGTFSDSASTATTSSSSSQSKQSSSNASRPSIATISSSAPMGGYAAALLKKASPSIPAKAIVGKSSSTTKKAVDRNLYDAAGAGVHKPSSSNAAGLKIPSVLKPSTNHCWGGSASGSKTSFADILRN